MGGSPDRVGVVVRREREVRGWSLRALAERAGISPTQLARIERLEASPTEETIRGLASALAVPIHVLFTEGVEGAKAATDVVVPPAFHAAVRELLAEMGMPTERRADAERLILATVQAICHSLQRGGE